MRANRQAPRRVAVMFVSAGLAMFAVLLSLRVGSLPVSWHDTLTALFHYPGAHATHEQGVVRILRVPRTVLGVAVGMAFAVAGALMQGLTRNPLADSGLLGINSGAELAVSLAIVWQVSTVGRVWLSLVGAAAAGAVVYALGSVGGGATPIKLALAGAILATFVGSITSALSVMYGSVARAASYGLLGGGSISLHGFWQVAPYLAVGLLLALGSGKALNGLSLGEEVARSLGQRVGVTRALVSASVVLLAGGAVALAGPIAFLGLIAPHVARRLMGPDYRWIIPATLGAPCFVFLARSKRAGSM
jgi:iron complex transport system permease protein